MLKEGSVELERFRMKHGCVVRAFSSVVGRNPTIVDWELRRKGQKRFFDYNQDSDDSTVESNSNILQFVRDAIRRHTPIGKELRDRSIEIKTVSYDQLRTLLQSGEDVIIRKPRHTAHIVLWAGLLISKSDNLLFFVKRNQSHPILIIHKKALA
ncbi:hypothetical protein A3A79_01655 [Candidatus Gottesmanbacteria bacterium RIFCSPLOWO2_01_FULL_43_11b]|uniref:Uncharacterized protein n=1 Tax=Candidatus Gottesmanbacteria bacterium RIFCSPLOWO2_01_FULL_43_11b TaxID=1798392 RepID=A0A1F6AH10_9BACT|nr:MAG: hypothetical protein A3A79_01655 [Candidatus Gottesmanbacteria bacterium RIFCSPLOWO2_01_FULL_43_11b]